MHCFTKEVRRERNISIPLKNMNETIGKMRSMNIPVIHVQPSETTQTTPPQKNAQKSSNQNTSDIGYSFLIGYLSSTSTKLVLEVS